MTDKVKKQQSASEFQLLYEKAVKKINEINIPTSVLPGNFLTKFLMFNSLPYNEQLELISDLSNNEGLPQGMTDAIKKFHYFDTLPIDILHEIGTHLKKKPKEDTDISALVAADKRSFGLFQPGRLLPQLLLNVATGNQNKAEKMVEMHPELQLVRGTVTDYSGRTFENITAYEYAYWAKDTHMCRMLEKHMDADTKSAMLKRCEEIEKNGLTYKQHGVEFKGSKHFDFTPLKNALQIYSEGFEGWYWTNNFIAIDEAWMQVGIALRDVPVHVANEYCRKDRSFYPMPEFDEETLPRELTFYNEVTNEYECWFPLVISESAGLGVSYAITRAGRVGSARGADGAGTEMAKDLKAIERLDEVRTNDLVRSRENLMLSEQNLNNNSFPYPH